MTVMKKIIDLVNYAQPAVNGELSKSTCIQVTKEQEVKDFRFTQLP